MKRGQVWWARLYQPAGRRPVLLLSRDAMPLCFLSPVKMDEVKQAIIEALDLK